ncbi:MAG: hypothetical protein AM326_11460 [Candidatus Thorarchaeota archaeon SMTZ-45]|nr:MAG: hypothetical protein AM326_11460 [Candidatus Thorarchaeota archaeon SMTZ-45]KXH73895.1 MAG: hypothetical protein AM325_06835 [Candidatus Thorarchaeota archaeon SMTZ1-45]
MTDQLELMVKYLVHLQFYSEEEGVLYSRDKKHRLSIKGIGPVVAAFEDEFKRHLHLIRRKEFRLFLQEIAKKIPFEVEPVLLQFNDSVRELGSHNLTDELSANFLIGPIRQSLQTREFEACMYEIRNEAIQRLGRDDAAKIVDDRISDFYSKNEFSVSMLHNLALLNLLTSLFGTEESKDRVTLIVEQFCEELITKLSSD